MVLACCCYILVPKILLLCYGIILKILHLLCWKRKENSSWIQWKLQADYLISCLCSQAHCFVSLSVWTSISGTHHNEYEVKDFSTGNLKTGLNYWTVNHVVLCRHFFYKRGHSFTLRGQLPHHWFTTPKHRLHLLYGYLWIWCIDQSSTSMDYCLCAPRLL